MGPSPLWPTAMDTSTRFRSSPSERKRRRRGTRPIFSSSSHLQNGLPTRRISTPWITGFDPFDDIISNANINVAWQLLLIELIMHLNCVVLFEQRIYLLKIQLNHGFQVRFVQISRNGKTIIQLLDKIKCPIDSTHNLEILLQQIKLSKQK